MKRHSFDFEVKELDDNGEFVGYLAVTGNKDEYDDVIEPGAFKKTNRENDRFPLLWQHQPDEPIGVLKDFEEDDTGEKVVGDINLETQKGKEAYSLLKQGAIKGLSIGYESVKDVIEEGIRRIKEIKLYEGSVVTFPANPLAMVQSVKTVVPMQDIPLASRDREWDADAADNRVRSWAGGPDKEDIDWERYRTAYMWYDADNPEEFGSYKLGYADVVDGDLQAIPRGIFAIAAVLQGARGGVDIPESDQARIKNMVERWYSRMRDEFDDDSIIVPWQEQDSLAPVLLQTVGISNHFKNKTLTNRHKRLIDETIDSLKSLRPTEPEDSTREEEGADTSDQEPDGTLGDLVADMKQYVNQQR